MTTQEKIDFVLNAMGLAKAKAFSDQNFDPTAKRWKKYEKDWKEVMDWLEGKFPPF